MGARFLVGELAIGSGGCGAVCDGFVGNAQYHQAGSSRQGRGGGGAGCQPATVIADPIATTGQAGFFYQ